MIDHFNLPVKDLAVSRAFYVPVLATLEYRLVLEEHGALGFGKNNWSFGLIDDGPLKTQLHLAFIASSVSQVKAFHTMALATGGTCNGGPGKREVYGPNYFAAFALDPDGHNIEAVFRND